MRLGEVNVACVGLALHSDFRLPEAPKYDFSELEKAMIHGVAWH